MSKTSDHITTYCKKQFSPITPSAEDVVIEDIAHALSLMTRANGHFPQFYSVGQHSIDCAKEAIAEGLEKDTVLACLLHDASEAYLSDITRPVKKHLEQYYEIEAKMQDTIYEALIGKIPSAESLVHVKRIDDMLLYHEFLHFMGEELYENPGEPKRMPSFAVETFERVEQEFLNLYKDYQ